MSEWWHYEPETGWFRHKSKSDAMDAALSELKAHADYASWEGWCDGIEQLSVWRTSAPKPEDADDDWIEENGEKIAETVECYRRERPEPPEDLSGEELEHWQSENWPCDWDYETIVDYELREITPPKGAKDE